MMCQKEKDSSLPCGAWPVACPDHQRRSRCCTACHCCFLVSTLPPVSRHSLWQLQTLQTLTLMFQHQCPQHILESFHLSMGSSTSRGEQQALRLRERLPAVTPTGICCYARHALCQYLCWWNGKEVHTTIKVHVICSRTNKLQSPQ